MIIEKTNENMNDKLLLKKKKKSLLKKKIKGIIKKSGRNNSGKITVYHKGGGHRKI